jgi:hypothetical protein
VACRLHCEGAMSDPSRDKLRRVCEHDQTRRDLLWLRAQEVEDTESIASLERADPALRARMRAFMAETRPDLIEDPRKRRRAFARLWQERYEEA